MICQYLWNHERKYFYSPELCKTFNIHLRPKIEQLLNYASYIHILKINPHFVSSFSGYRSEGMQERKETV